MSNSFVQITSTDVSTEKEGLPGVAGGAAAAADVGSGVVATVVASEAADVDAADAAVAEAACSYTIEATTFDTAVDGLISRASSTIIPATPRAAKGNSCDQVATAAASAASSPTIDLSSTTPSWLTCTKNLGDAIARTTPGARGYIDMFARYFRENREELCKPLNFSSGDVLNDLFFKSTTCVNAPGGGLSKHQGPVVYFSSTVARFASVCLPIGEYYRAAIKAHVAAPRTNTKKRLLPTLTLLDFYLAMYHSLSGDDEAREALLPNIYDLCDAAEAQAPGSGPGRTSRAGSGGGSSSGGDGMSAGLAGAFSGAGGIGAMISGLLATMGGGAGGEKGAAPPNFAAALGGITNVVKTLVDRVSNEESIISAQRGPDGSLDPAAIVGCIGNAFQSPEIQKQIAETTRVARGAFGLSPTTTVGAGAGAASSSAPTTTTSVVTTATTSAPATSVSEVVDAVELPASSSSSASSSSASSSST